MPPTTNGFFLLLVTPPLTGEDAPIAKDVIMVLDTSGSMEGQKLDQAKAAAKYVLNHLDAEDRFNIVSFSSAVHAFEAAPVPVTGAPTGCSSSTGCGHRAARTSTGPCSRPARAPTRPARPS